MSDAPSFSPSCPAPLHHDTVQLSHGGGGRHMRELIEKIFLAAFEGEAGERHDSAVLPTPGPDQHLAFTTDSYVVSPRTFPGGDIGSLAVFGTVNDLAMAGATPRWLSAGFVLEEGLPVDELTRVVASMRAAANRCGVRIVTGDTKVVDHGKGDGVFINTAGIGTVPTSLAIGPRHVASNAAVLVSGDVGRHGIAVMSVREGLRLSGAIESDCGPLHEVVADLLAAEVQVQCMRDLTRGGLASALNEIAMDGGYDIAIDESAVAVHSGVRGACELLGLDPLYVACEGRMLLCVAPEHATRALDVLRLHDDAAAIIGHCRHATGDRPARVTAKGPFGAHRVLDLLAGEQLPRIC